MSRRRIDRHERTHATREQVNPIRRGTQHPSIPDEADPPKGFPKKAASFHKLLTHEDGVAPHTSNTGLLDPQGLQSYQHLIDGLKLDGSSEFDQDSLNQIVPGNPGPGDASQRRVLINPQSSKALSLKGADITAFWFKKKSSIASPAWEMGYDVRYGGTVDHSDLLKELSLRTAVTAAEMIEVYAMAILRNEALDALATSINADVSLALAALNSFGADFKGPKDAVTLTVTAKTLFRGNSPADQLGDYRSMFLRLKRPPLFPSGCAPQVGKLTGADIFFESFAEELKVPDPNPDLDFGLTWDHYVKLQNGFIPRKYQTAPFYSPSNPPPPPPVPPQIPPPDLAYPPVVVNTGRQAASLVHIDSLYQEWSWALDILTGDNYDRSKVSPYAQPITSALGAKYEGDGPTLGPPDAAGLVGAVALEAARAAWSQKWLTARRARPETMAGLIQKQRPTGWAPTSSPDPATYGPLDSKLLALSGPVHALFQRVEAVNLARGGGAPDTATVLLGQAFPEGSPGHPAWPSGHATVAGACATVIKAIFDDQAPVTQQIMTPPGVKPPPFLDQNGQPLLVGRELDKLASNIALARSFAGVHYRSDGEHGILLGEAVAIRYLQDHLRTYREKFVPPPGGTHLVEPYFALSKRSGQRIHIFVDHVADV